MNDIDRIETEFMKKKIDRDKVSMSATNVSKMFTVLREQDAEIGRLNKQVGLYYNIDAARTKKIQELQQENEQLKAFTPKQGECIYDVEQIRQIMAQNAAMREAIQDFINKANILTGSDEKIIAEDSTYWKFKKVLSFIAADYNNPTDVAEIEGLKKQIAAHNLIMKEHCKTIVKQMVALVKARSALIQCNRGDLKSVREAIAVVDAIGGQENGV
jgi:hypothetical protein